MPLIFKNASSRISHDFIKAKIRFTRSLLEGNFLNYSLVTRVTVALTIIASIIGKWVSKCQALSPDKGVSTE